MILCVVFRNYSYFEKHGRKNTGEKILETKYGRQNTEDKI